MYIKDTDELLYSIVQYQVPMNLGNNNMTAKFKKTLCKYNI